MVNEPRQRSCTYRHLESVADVQNRPEIIKPPAGKQFRHRRHKLCERECLGCCRSTMKPGRSEDADATTAENYEWVGRVGVVPKQLHRFADSVKMDVRESGTLCAEMLKCFLRRILMLASFCATSNSISTSPHHIRAFEVADGVVWCQETGACAGSFRHPPPLHLFAWETTKNACVASRVVLSENSNDLRI